LRPTRIDGGKNLAQYEHIGFTRASLQGLATEGPESLPGSDGEAPRRGGNLSDRGRCQREKKPPIRRGGGGFEIKENSPGPLFGWSAGPGSTVLEAAARTKPETIILQKKKPPGGREPNCEEKTQVRGHVRHFGEKKGTLP